MKKLIVLVLAFALVLSMAACGGSAKLANSITLKADDDEETHYEVKLGYPNGATLDGTDLSDYCTITSESKDYEIYAVLVIDTTYEENKEYDKETYELYQEGKFAGFDGYSNKQSDYTYHAAVMLSDTEYESEAVYMDFTIGSASRDLEKPAEQIFQIDEVQQILNSIEFLGKNPEDAEKK